MISKDRIQAIAARLRDAEASREVIAPVRGEIAPDDITTAYAV
ncbi:2-keto-4-pentenoate hydratase, partial [Paraburkholderia lycopersici]